MSEIPVETVRAFVIAAHTDLATVEKMLTERPDLLNVEFDWGPGGGFETGLGAAAHMGNRPIAEFFLGHGAPPTICVMAMLGETAQVKGFLSADSTLANARGAHGIPILFHAAMSGKTDLTTLLKDAGCTEGYASALHGAINFGHMDMVAWLLSNGARPDELDFQGKTPLARAIEENQPKMVDLLRAHGATA
jgi:ankyrin repeat protein